MALSRKLAILMDRPLGSRRLAAGLFFLLVNWLMLAPSSTFDDVGDWIPHQDKITHTAVFLLLALLVRWSLTARQGRGRRLVVVFAVLLLYAGSIEALQPLLGGEGRQFDWLDMASNFVGSCSGWLLYAASGATRLQREAGVPGAGREGQKSG